MSKTQYFSRVPSESVRPQIDGNLYANVPHRYDHQKRCFVEDYDKPRMVRADAGGSFVRNGEAYIWIATLGSALADSITSIPFGMSMIRAENIFS